MTEMLSNGERFGNLIEEQNDVDFPYYNGQPVDIKISKWILAWIGTIAGLFLLLIIPSHSNIEMIPARALFLAIPLAIFWYLFKPHWKAIFKRPRGKDYWYMVLFALLNLVITSIIGLIVQKLGFHTSATAATNGLAHARISELVAFYVGTGWRNQNV